VRFSLWPNAVFPAREIVSEARDADAAGWHGVWIADHYMPNTGDRSVVPGVTHEAWALLPAIAATTERVRIGSLVAPTSVHHPAVLANRVATIDHLSQGRMTLGIGAGWQVNEHAAYGIELSAPGERLERLEEACAVISSLLREPRTTFAGKHYQLDDAPCDPKPVNGHLPLLVGGGGEQRTLRIAARYADEWNAWATPDVFKHKSGVLDGHCDKVGRDPGAIRRSTQALVFLSRDESWLARFRDQPPGMPRLVGTPSEVVDQVGAYQAVGVDELIVPDWTMGPAERTHETLELFWTEVASQFR